MDLLSRTWYLFTHTSTIPNKLRGKSNQERHLAKISSKFNLRFSTWLIFFVLCSYFDFQHKFPCPWFQQQSERRIELGREKHFGGKNDTTLWEHFWRAPKEKESKGAIPRICQVTWKQMFRGAMAVVKTECGWEGELLTPPLSSSLISPQNKSSVCNLAGGADEDKGSHSAFPFLVQFPVPCQ